jgi:putative hydrolase of the HAD superfamily
MTGPFRARVPCGQGPTPAIFTLMSMPTPPPRSEPADLVLVDFDDTLVLTAPRFSSARRRFFQLLGEHGFAPDLVEQVHHDEVDPVMRQQHGYGPQRLGHAFRETYRSLCERSGRRMDPAIQAICARLGDDVVGTPPAIAGALEALARLARALPTAIYTQSGDAAYQLGCLREAGVLGAVGEQRIRVVPVKTAAALEETLDAFGVSDPGRAWVIGNSLRSDVNPALEIGARAVLVEIDDPWHHDVVEPLHNGFPRVPSFAAAVDLLLGRPGP